MLWFRDASSAELRDQVFFDPHWLSDRVIGEVLSPFSNFRHNRGLVKQDDLSPIADKHGIETDRLIGLELGADDYITKPFSPRELVM